MSCSLVFNFKITTFCLAMVQERTLFKKYFFNPEFADIIQEQPLFNSDHYWRQYSTLKKNHTSSNFLASSFSHTAKNPCVLRFKISSNFLARSPFLTVNNPCVLRFLISPNEVGIKTNSPTF